MSYAWGSGEARRGPAWLPDRTPLDVARAEPAAPAPEADPRAAVDLDLRRLAAALAPMVDVWQRLLLQHTADETGRCRTCTKGGTGLPTTRWPCSIHGIADLARRCHDRADRPA